MEAEAGDVKLRVTAKVENDASAILIIAMGLLRRCVFFVPCFQPRLPKFWPNGVEVHRIHPKVKLVPFDPR